MSPIECRVEARFLRLLVGCFTEENRKIVQKIADAWDGLALLKEEQEIIHTRYLISN